MNKDMPILVIGAGSIGERHIRNLWALGFRNLYVYRQRNLPFMDIGDAQVKVLLKWDEIVQTGAEVAFICTPTSQHLQQATLCIDYSMHVFVEKPLSHNLDNFTTLKTALERNKKMLQVGFMMRFHPFILKIKKAINENSYGKLISMESHWGSYLPDWHPWENYKESYAANREMGGGVALTLCHDIDLALWLAGGELETYTSTTADSKDLDIDTESVADFNFTFKNHVSATVHLNFLDNPPIRYYKFKFEEAAVDFNYFENSMSVAFENKNNAGSIEYLENFDRNQLYVDEVQSFFSLIDGHENPAAYSLNQVKESELIIKICTT